jgi:hypothetical protein
MQNAAQPTPPARRRRGRGGILAKYGVGHKNGYKKQDNAARHERDKQPEVFGVAKFLSNPLSSGIGMKPFCAFAFCMLFALVGLGAKQRHCTLRVHTQANPRDTNAFATSGGVAGKEVAIDKMPWITERDVIAFSPYSAPNGTFGALLQLDDHGRVVLDSLSVERRGGFLFVFINGRFITELQIDRRVSDGKIYIPSGLTAADIDLMKKDWRLIGQGKRHSR